MYKVLFVGNSKECSRVKEQIKWNKIGYEITDDVTHIYFAFEIIKAKHIDVIFIDLDGCSHFDLEFIKEIKQLSKDIKIIYIADKNKYKMAGESLGKNISCLIKPLGKNEIKLAERVLKEYKKERDALKYLDFILNDKNFEDEILLNLSAKNYDYFNNLFEKLSNLGLSKNKED